MTPSPDVPRDATTGLRDQDPPPRVMIVEDNADLARLMGVLLRQYGFEVRTLNEGNQAYETARAFHPHVVLLDIGLPGMDGYQVADLIRADPQFRDVLIVAISAYARDFPTGRTSRPAFDFQLTKPVSIEELLPLIMPGEARMARA